MSERISSWQNFEHNPQKQRIAAERVGQQALRLIDRQYGCGYPLWRPGSKELSYHNGHHARAVGSGALKVSTRLGLPPTERTISKTAGYAHDLVQLKGRGRDEEESAEWYESELEKTGLFPPALRSVGALAIRGTEPLFSNGRITGQMVSRLTYPTKEAELVAKSVACGDFGELYTPAGPYLGHQLFREIHGMPSERHLPFDKIIGFQRHQIGLLESYTYPLREADSLLATHRPQVIKYSHSILRGLERGEIESWGDLIERDEQFIRQNQ